MRLTNCPFVYILQVRKQYGKCIRTSDRFLLVLPCPWQYSAVCEHCMTYFKKLLLMGGDIESNPGPDLEKIAKQLTEIAADIKDIKEKRLSDIDNKLDVIAKLEAEVAACHKELACMNGVIRGLEARIDDLENRSRRSNLIIYGVPEPEGETSETLERAVNEGIIREILDLEPVAIERIHRLGRGGLNKTRPVILKLLDAREKTAVLKNGFKLKGTEFSIGEDFSRKLRETRKKLWDSAKENRENKEKVSLAYNKLFINSRVFIWDDEKNERVEIKKYDKVEQRKNEANRPATRQSQRKKK